MLLVPRGYLINLLERECFNLKSSPGVCDSLLGSVPVLQVKLNLHAQSSRCLLGLGGDCRAHIPRGKHLLLLLLLAE